MAILPDRTALTTPADGDLYMTTDVSDTTDAATGTDKKITFANLKTGIGAALITQTISNGVTTTAPSEDVVYDALALKAPLASPTFTGTVTVPVGLTGVLRADTGVVSVDTDVTDIVTAGTEGAAGKLELATDAEAVTGTDTARAVTPANVTARLAAPGTIGGTTPGAITGTTITANTGVMPDANDGAYLGQAGTAFSDLFLAEGGVINWDSGDATLTQASNMVTLAGADLTVPNMTVGAAGVVTLSENASIALDPAGSADGKYSGITVTGTAGAALAFGDLCYLDPTDSRWELADANAAAAADGDARGILGICVLAAAGDASATTMLLHGIVRADTAFPALTIGAPVYVSETAGDIVVTQPTTTDVVIRIVGVAITADEIFFNPDFTWTTHT